MNSKNYNGQATQEQIIEVLKILLLPDEIFKIYMSILTLEELKQ